MSDTSLTIHEAYELLGKKETTPVELTEAFLARIKELDGKINAYLSINHLEAIEAAEKATKLLDDQTPCWLTGVPMALKDNISTKGLRTTAGSKVLEDYDPVYDATVVERLRAVKSVILGKTNLDEFAMGSSTENSAFKKTKNPWDLQRVPGGSSGGSAAAVAADLCVFALGSDTGGSIREPASFCGVVGLKPTYGRVSRYGLIAMASSLDQIGSLTKDVTDAALVLNIIAGFDPRDSTSSREPLIDFSQNIAKGVKGLRIGLPGEYFAEGLDSSVKEVVLTAVKKLETLGAEVVEISLPTANLALPVYYLLMPSEASANLARFDGVRFGKGRENFGDEIKRRIMLGTYALSSGYYDDYYLKAAKVRTLIKEDFAKAFEKVDLIAGPVAPTTAFKIGEKVENPLIMYLSDIYTIPANLIGSPSISVPAGFAEGLPVGLQLMGRNFEEETLLQASYALEKSLHLQEKPKL